MSRRANIRRLRLDVAEHDDPQKCRSSSKAGAADFGYLRRSPSGRWGLWATRRVVQGPVGKLLELVHRGRQSPRPSGFVWPRGVRQARVRVRRPGASGRDRPARLGGMTSNLAESLTPRFDEEPEMPAARPFARASARVPAQATSSGMALLFLAAAGRLDACSSASRTPVALALDLDDVGMVDDTLDESGGACGIREDGVPILEG